LWSGTTSAHWLFPQEKAHITIYGYLMSNPAFALEPRFPHPDSRYTLRIRGVIGCPP
jgi:hypothetical protein